MKAIVYKESLQIDHPESLIDMELPDPEPGPADLLVRVEAISVNPVDCKVRQSMPKPELQTINAENLRRGHALLEKGGGRGKVVLAGFGA